MKPVAGHELNMVVDYIVMASIFFGSADVGYTTGYYILRQLWKKRLTTGDKFILGVGIICLWGIAFSLATMGQEHNGTLVWGAFYIMIFMPISTVIGGIVGLIFNLVGF